MADVKEFPRNGNRPDPLPEPPKMILPKIIIEQLSNGEIQVMGPLVNRMLCFGMLAEAHKIVSEYKASPIIPA
jgi:hypothetical protein